MLHWKNRIALLLLGAAVVASLAGFVNLTDFADGFYW
jgi:hypothetical protein